MLDNVESLRDVSDKQWDDFAFPVGILNKIKSKIAEQPQNFHDKQINEIEEEDEPE